MASAKENKQKINCKNSRKEPDNLIDSKAIAFACDVSKTCERVGNLVQEALDEVAEVHKAMDDGGWWIISDVLAQEYCRAYKHVVL